jgi:hypothetical protein
VVKLQDGVCKVAKAPEFEVKGVTEYDQVWITETTEGLVGGCKQKRPKPRPAEWDKKPEESVKTEPTPVPAPTPAPPKKPWWKRLRGA